MSTELDASCFVNECVRQTRIDCALPRCHHGNCALRKQQQRNVRAITGRRAIKTVRRSEINDRVTPVTPTFEQEQRKGCETSREFPPEYQG